MADATHIEWTDATWNPITGCSVVSPGCTNCYAMKLAGTRLKHTASRAGLTIDTKAGPVWNGEVRFNEQWLAQPLRWKRPRKIFVCAHGDLFHESVPDAWIDRVFAAMAMAPHHTFQVLTNRETRERAKSWIDKAPMNAVMTLAESKRSIPQNDRMHAMLTDVARQVPIWGGVKAGKDEWKLIFLDGLKREMRLVPNLDGTGVVSLSGKSSSELTKTEMSDMIELMFQFGAHPDHPVQFNDPESVAARAAEAANNPSADVAA